MRDLIPGLPLNVDAYQAGHIEVIPPGMENFEISQATHRHPLHYGGDETADNRLMHIGMPLYIHDVLSKRITQTDIDEATYIYEDFHAHVAPPYSRPYPWPKDLFQLIVDKYDGIAPLCITALPDGHAHYVGEPAVQVWTDVPNMGELVGWIESSMLPYIWTSTVVATRGRIRKDRFVQFFKKYYPELSYDDIHQIIMYNFHDFGARGAANSRVTGVAHLLNWLGTDTMSAVHASVYALNDRQKFGACSVMAAAHRTITSWPTEDAAYAHQIPKYAETIQSIVADSYDYFIGVEKIAQYANIVKAAGGKLVARPDSGDPVECVVRGLQILEKYFGHTLSSAGLKILNNSAIIQGDGVSDKAIFEKILPAVVAAGFCPRNVAFGMGEYNHRAVRSDIETGYKTCMVGSNTTESGYMAVMKGSNTLWKRSFPCPVKFENNKYENRIKPITVDQLKAGDTGEYVVHYDGRPNGLPVQKYNFASSRELAYSSWNELAPIVSDTIDPRIRKMQENYLATH